MIRRILTGMRTTGRLHLGHYVGALQNWLKFQTEYDCYFLLADVQALTTHFDRVAQLEDSVRQVVTDWLSVGLNPNTSSFLLQSRVKEYYELTSYFTFLVKMGALERNPTLQEEIKTLGMSEVNLGFMMYPVSQASDILLFSPKPSDGGELLVPAGADQDPLIELARDVARSFNAQYGETFVLPLSEKAEVSRLGDLSGGQKKMGKSYGNAIYLSDTPDVVSQKVRQGVTDPQKVRKGDPGDPEICPIYSYHKIFRPQGVAETESGCRSGSLGCVECKANLAGALNQMLDPIRAQRAEIEQHPTMVADAVSQGTARARVVGRETIQIVRQAMHLNYSTITGGLNSEIPPLWEE